MARLLAPLVLLCLVTLPPASAAATDQAVTLTDRATPSSVTIAVGDPLTIRNADDVRHRMRAREPEDVDSSDIDPGGSAVVRFPIAGRYVLTDDRTDDLAYELTVEVHDGAAPSARDGSDGSAPGGGSVSGDGAAPGGGPTGGAASPAPSTTTVTIRDRRFSPRRVTVAAGGTVTWQNRDGTHTVTAEDRSWDSGLFDDGASFRRTFRAAGTYDYLCLLHPEMTGTVEVVASDGSTPSSPAGASPTPATGGSATAAPAGSSSVAIRDFAFATATLRASPGTSVTWTNRGEAVHNVASVGDGPLGSALLEPGGTYRARFDEVGTFDYRCDLHPAMTGRVVVAAGGASEAVDPQGDPDAALAGAPSPEGGRTPSATGERHELRISGFAYDPIELKVTVGDTLVWRNEDEAPHTVTSTDGGPLASATLRTDDAYEVVVTDPGTYAYRCELHPAMTGTVEVVSDASVREEAATSDGAVGDPRGASSAGAAADAGRGRGLAPVAAVMLLFMGAAFVVGRVTADP